MQEMTSNRDISGAALARPLDCRAPNHETLRGPRVSLRAISAVEDAPVLYGLSHGGPRTEKIWDYMPYGPFADVAEFRGWMEGCAGKADPIFYVIEDPRHGPRGMCSFMDIQPAHGAIEIGHVWFVPDLQRTTQATEVIYLMMRHAFEVLGNRRLQWKCDAMNDASRRAARRFGFGFEGIAYQHKVVKGRNRDSAYYSLMDHEWPGVDACFRAWLSDSNFDAEGRQRSALSLHYS